MKERLTYRDENGIAHLRESDLKDPCEYCYNATQQLAHYEDLEEAGRLVELPCAVGDIVYGIHQERTILPMVVKWFETNYGWTVAAQYTPMSPKFYHFDDFGKTVFLTREEAEAALKESEKE